MSEGYAFGMAGEGVSSNLARNIRQLRQARGLTQQQLAKLSDLPRPTWANLESGNANPTVAVLVKVAAALHVSVEALISPPRSTTKLYLAAKLPSRRRGEVLVRQVLPDRFGGLELDRMELAPGSRMVGTPHKAGTREYLSCELGKIELAVSGERWSLLPGDVVVFRGDQRHSYANPSDKPSVGYSLILVGPTPP